MSDSRTPARSFAIGRRLAAALVLGAAGGAIAIATAAPAHAQEVSASLRGKITPADQVQSVTAVQVDTGVRRTVNTSPEGDYNLASLRPGSYRLEIATTGGVRQTDVFTLNVAQNALLNFDLAELALGVSDEPAVEAAPSGNVILVTSGRIRSLEGGEVGDVVTQREIDTLPQNNRNFLAFADTAPGVQFITGANGNSRLQGGAQDSRSVNIFIDGVGQKDYVLKNGITGQDSTQGNPFPQLAVGEYRVISSNYKAEFDQVSSVAITAVTKSGTNEFHGEAFIDFTNQDLRAKTALEAFRGDEKVETKDLQYGGALGGPIIRDTLFFFGSYEGKRQEVPVEILPGGGFTVGAFPAQFQDVFGVTNREFNEDLYFGKIDFIPTDRDLFQVSVKYRDESGQNLNSGLSAQSTSTDVDTEELRGLFRYERTQENWINDFKVSYEDVHWAPTPRVFENGSVFQNGNQGTVLIVGGSANFQDKGQEGWTVQDDFTWIGSEGHTVKLGAKAKWVELNTLQQNFFNARYTYNIAFNPGGGTFNDQIPYQVQFGALSGVGTPIVTSDNFQFGIYLQDDWEVNERLTLNLGIRWDYEETPAYLDFVTPADAIAAVSPQNYPNILGANYNINNFISTGSERDPFMKAIQPRIGFSYSLDEDGRFAVFGGYGRSYDRNQFDFLQQEISIGSYTTRTFNFITGDPLRDCAPPSSTCLPFDPIYLTEAGRQQLLAGTPGGAGGRGLRFITNELRVPYSDQFSLGMRGQFDLIELEAGYRHIDSKDGFAYLLGNRRPDGSFFPANAPPNSPFGFSPPGFGSITLGVNGLETSEDVAHLKMTKRYSEFSRWNMTATYTYTEAEENREFGETFSLDFPSLADYPVVRSSGVPRHRFVMVGSADAPYGLVFSGKFQIQSPIFLKGFVNQQVAPFERLVVGGEVEGNGSKWGARQLDVAITKYISLPFLLDEARVRLRVDIINLLNDRNFTQFNGNVNDTTRTPTSPTIFGERTGFGTGGYPPRTIKLSAGFSF